MRDRRRGECGGFSLSGAGGVYQARNSGSLIIPASAAARIANAIDASYMGFSSMRLNQASVDAVIDAIYRAVVADANHYTAATPIVLQIGGSGGLINAAPSGTYQYVAGPSTGLEKIYYLNHLSAHAWLVAFNGAIAEDSLLGNVIGTGEKTWAASGTTNTQLRMQKFSAVAGSIVDIRIKFIANSNAKVAIYADSAGAPGALLAESGSTACAPSWNTIQINTPVTLNAQSYWLAWKSSVSDKVSCNTTGGTSRYATVSYADAFPDPAPAMMVSAYDWAVAGWGAKVV